MAKRSFAKAKLGIAGYGIGKVKYCLVEQSKGKV